MYKGRNGETCQEAVVAGNWVTEDGDLEGDGGVRFCCLGAELMYVLTRGGTPLRNDPQLRPRKDRTAVK